MTKEKMFNQVWKPIEKYIRIRFPKHYEDCFPAAMAQVWKDLDKFDSSHPNANLELWCINSAKRGAFSYLRKSLGILKDHRLKNLKILEVAKNKLVSENRYDIDNLSLETGFSIKKIRELESIKSLLYPIDITSKYQKCRRQHEDEEVPLIEEVVPDRNQSHILRKLLFDLLALLPEEEARIIYLKDYEEYDLTEIREMDGNIHPYQWYQVKRNKGIERLRSIVSEAKDANTRIYRGILYSLL